MSVRVLCVDDEPRVLEGLELHLGMEHDVATATSGRLGLELLESEAPYDVVISDMRMPEMDGATFLMEVQRRAPQTMRVLLTGQTDLASAVRAINEGNIYRFLTKPCPPELLLGVVEDAAETRRLRLAERELLERTLHGCVEVLTEVLGVVSPVAFHRAQRAREVAKRLAPILGGPDDRRWQLEVAALLTGLGSIAVPHDLLERAVSGEALSDDEREMMKQIPVVGARLLAKVPRLEGVAELVGRATSSLTPREVTIDPQLRALEVALWMDEATTSRGLSWTRARTKLEREVGAEIAKHVGEEPSSASGETRAVRGKDIAPGMHVCEDIFTVDGQCVVRAGTDVTRALAMRLRAFAENIGLQEPIWVCFTE